ncbi:MAG: YraN family protein [bacterium]
MAGARQELGRMGEGMAAAALDKAGYTIIERNYRCQYGEVDIIAREGGDLVFIEVKTRRSRTFGHPAEAVGPRKREHLLRVAAHYLQSHSPTEGGCRFDVVAVHLAANRSLTQVEIIRGAFGAG